MKNYSAVVLAALAATASAVKFTNPAVNPEPGKPFELTWTEAEGPVTINLKGGSSDNLQTIETLACMCPSPPAIARVHEGRRLTDLCSQRCRRLDRGHS